MRVKLPRSRTRKIGERARQIAIMYGRKKGWKSSDDIEIVSEDGKSGLKPSHKYLMYQEKGTKPRDMVELEGKTIPMPVPGGGTRFVRVKGVGKPGYATLPGGVKVWRERKWHHPGIKPTHFMENAIKQAVQEDLQNQGFFRKVVGRISGRPVRTPKQWRR